MARVLNFEVTPELLSGAASLVRAILWNKAFRAPMDANFDLTWRCNLRCEHCYFSASIRSTKPAGWRPRELSDDQWRRVFRYFRARGTRSASLTGGEPTLRMNLVEEAVRVFPAVQVATNGLVPIPRHLNCAIWVSLDGKPETHDKIRGAKCFHRVVENMTDDPRVSVSCTLSTTNYREAEFVVETCARANVKGVFFMLYGGTKDSPLFLRGKKLAATVRSLRRLVHEFPDFVLLSERMLASYVTKDFVPTCCFLGENALVQSFFPDLTRKRCVMGDNVDCQTCSCIVPVASHCLRALDGDTAKKVVTILRQDRGT